MFKNYMLICDEWIGDFEWQHQYLFFDNEDEMKNFITSSGDVINVERMCKLEDVQM